MDIQNMLQHWPLQSVAAIVAGVVVLLIPRVLNYAVAIYLLLIGGLGIMAFLYGRAIGPMAVISMLAGVLILIKPTILNYVIGLYLILTGLFEAGVFRM